MATTHRIGRLQREMGKRRRLALQHASDDEDDDAPQAPKPAAPDSSRRHSAADDPGLVDDNVLEEMRRDGEEERREETQTRRQRPPKRGRPAEEELEEKAEANDDDEDGPEAVPVGEPVEVSADGKHYAAFEYDGTTYKLEDTAMFSPDDPETQKPYVGIIKEIISKIDRSLSVTAQWFYRPEEAQKEGGDPRELFYSSHLDDVAAESVMHTCVVHFIPQHKQVPSKKDHPGFIVQEVYDHKDDKFYEVTAYYDDDIQQEINILVMKTMDRIGDLSDRHPEDIPGENSDNLPRQGQRKRSLKPKDVPRDAPAGRSEQLIKEDTAGKDNLKNCARAILSRYKAVTDNKDRNWWLEKFVGTILALPHSRNDNENSYAPNEVMSIVASLERSTYEALQPDFPKYNQKMRTFLYNITNSSVLCRRLMNRELDPPVLLTMAPDELKAGLTPAEIGGEFEEPTQLQMTKARCKRCDEKNVGISNIVRANRGDRYQVECVSCGFGWSASRDEVV